MSSKTAERTIPRGPARCRQLASHVEREADEIEQELRARHPLEPDLREALADLRRAADDLKVRAVMSEPSSPADVATAAFETAVAKARCTPRRERPVVDLGDDDVVVFPSSQFDPAEVLQFLAMARKTGAIVIPRDGETVTVEIDDGVIVNATSTNNPAELRLGKILVDQNAVDDVRLIKFIARCDRDPRRLGRALVEGRLVSWDAVLRALRHQIVHLFQRCLVDPGGPIEFRARRREKQTDDIALDLAGVLLEGITAFDESRR